MTLRIYTAFGVSQTPIIFKLKRRQMTSAQSICFTFQSGSIQILSDSISSMYCSNFTFQSGSIQIVSGKSIEYGGFTLHSNLVLFKFYPSSPSLTVLISLHSNLVLFKFTCFCPDINFIKYFTFQSGSIQIRMSQCIIRIQITLHSNLVLFKFEVSPSE